MINEQSNNTEGDDKDKIIEDLIKVVQELK